jgi:hypothetical protein
MATTVIPASAPSIPKPGDIPLPPKSSAVHKVQQEGLAARPPGAPNTWDLSPPQLREGMGVVAELQKVIGFKTRFEVNTF